ncbi:MAG: tripartite tricarboxylate transporter substrate binding protein [Burkholderiales bacterium]
MRRTLIAIAGTLLTLAAAAASAQSYPTRAIRLIVPYSTGTATDALARTIALKLSDSLGQQVVVDNLVGANGITGSAVLTKAAPDGYTLIMFAANHVVNASLYSKLPYDTLKDFKPIVRVAFAPFVLAVHPSLPAKDLKEFLALARARPGEINYGSPSNGSPPHLAVELLKAKTGVNLVHIPYKTAAQAQTDVIGGQVPVMVFVAAAAVPQIKAGRLRALGVTTSTRLSQLPEVPTIAEAGVKDFEMISWIGFAGPAGLPADLVSRLGTEITRVVQQPDTAERIRGLGLEISLMQAEAFAAYMAAEQARWGEVVRRAGARLD